MWKGQIAANMRVFEYCLYPIYCIPNLTLRIGPSYKQHVSVHNDIDTTLYLPFYIHEISDSRHKSQLFTKIKQFRFHPLTSFVLSRASFASLHHGELPLRSIEF